MAGVPLNRMPTCVFVLYSIHNVMKAEKILKQRGIAFDTIPVPKEISSDCGMALMVARHDRGSITRILEEHGLDIKGIYLKTEDGYKEMAHG